MAAAAAAMARGASVAGGRFRGCLFGALLGDCLGGEFEARESVEFAELLRFVRSLDRSPSGGKAAADERERPAGSAPPPNAAAEQHASEGAAGGVVCLQGLGGGGGCGLSGSIKTGWGREREGSPAWPGLAAKMPLRSGPGRGAPQMTALSAGEMSGGPACLPACEELLLPRSGRGWAGRPRSHWQRLSLHRLAERLVGGDAGDGCTRDLTQPALYKRRKLHSTESGHWPAWVGMGYADVSFTSPST